MVWKVGYSPSEINPFTGKLKPKNGTFATGKAISPISGAVVLVLEGKGEEIHGNRGIKQAQNTRIW